MCGIAGILNLKDLHAAPTLEQLGQMASALRHRGPDEFGAYRDAQVGLAHTRLSIIDLATGQQPLASPDERFWIVFNGEIFNYLELRDELVAQGFTFRTQSDTEVIIRAYEAWGQEAFQRFNGQWAIALWDRSTRRLLLSRDRVGVRPLYLCEHQGQLFFASEVKAIFAAAASIPRELDPRGLDETFTFWTVVPPQTVFRGVTELEPGHTRIYSPRGVETRCDWRPRFPPEVPSFKGSLEDAAEAVHHALLQAVRLRMLRADVPVGSYLSGGLDSSLVAALGRQVKGDRFSTFSLCFEDAEYDETPFQRKMAAQLGTDHREVRVSRADIADALPEVIFHTERPLLRTAPAPLFLLSRRVRESGIKVVLTGEGADEMFAGYDLFREAKVRRFWARDPASSLRPRLLERLYPYLSRSPSAQRKISQQFFGRDLARSHQPGFSHQPRWQAAASLKRLFSPALRAGLEGDVVADLTARLPAAFSSWTALAQDQFLEITTLLSGYLLSSQGDRMLMANSVEGRFPFLDADVMALANSLPPSYKLKVLDEKHVLKLASVGRVPPEIIARTKQPYRAPDAISFVGPQAPRWVEDCLTEAALHRVGVFDVPAARRLWAKCSQRVGSEPFSNADNMALVGVLSTQLLHQELIASRPAARPVTWTTLKDQLQLPERMAS